MKSKIWRSVCFMLVSYILCVYVVADDILRIKMSKKERAELKEEARDMFYHAYRAYMENAYPADELMPLSCKGRYRGVTPNRGDMDDILGNFSLTLVDSLDTLVILGDFEEFEYAVKLVIRDVSFDKNIVVSVFETNIRMLGGLLSAHILATGLQEMEYLSWYRGELLDLAHDLGKRLLPAFNTSTGIPHARINLRHGMIGIENSRETCTACAGTMILEMAALSRLTGDPVFEKKAHDAMDRLWKIRNRTSDLMGTVVNVHSGDWIRKNSGVGAGIDSYYEYCLKAYILLGDETYLARFYRHYNAVMKYISRGPMMLDVHMHRPHTQSRHFMDALLAFWPGLQVLLGDVRSAIETHEMLYQVMQRHTFIPEAFTADFQVHWGQHPLRPEFLESTYFLHRATGDDHYLYVAKAALKSLQKHARVPCGYAAMNDVRTRIHEDRMDSFVLAETFKYLYLLFADDCDIPINLDEFIMTTEAHLLPLTLADNRRNRTINIEGIDDDHHLYPYSRTCPNTQKFLPESVRRPLKNMLGECRNQVSFRRLLAWQFRPTDPDHISALSEMGISVLTLKDGRVQLLQTFSMARSAKDAEEGLIFMREMAELSEKTSSDVDGLVKPQAVVIMSTDPIKVLPAGPAHFGLELKGQTRVVGTVTFSNPLKACGPLLDVSNYRGKIIVAERGDCTFADKVRKLQKEGALGVIITDNIPGSSHATSPLFAMSGDGENDVSIPAVFLYSQDADSLKYHIMEDPNSQIILGEKSSIEKDPQDLLTQKSGPFHSMTPLQLNLHETKQNSASDDDTLFVGIKPESVLKTIKPRLSKIDSTVNRNIIQKDIPKRHHWLESIISEFESQLFFVKENKDSSKAKVDQKIFESLLKKVNLKPNEESESHFVENTQNIINDENISDKLKKHLDIITDRMGSIETINQLLKDSYANIATTLMVDAVLSDKNMQSEKYSKTEKDDIVIGIVEGVEKAELILKSYLLGKQNSDVLKTSHSDKVDSSTNVGEGDSAQVENVSSVKVNSNILEMTNIATEYSQHTTAKNNIDLDTRKENKQFSECQKQSKSFLTIHTDCDNADEDEQYDDSILQLTDSSPIHLSGESIDPNDLTDDVVIRDACKDCHGESIVHELVEEYQKDGPTR